MKRRDFQKHRQYFQQDLPGLIHGIRFSELPRSESKVRAVGAKGVLWLGAWFIRVGTQLHAGPLSSAEVE